MDTNPSIKCTVFSCKYNDNAKKHCELAQIEVSPMPNCQTQKADESMCSSYKCNM